MTEFYLEPASKDDMEFVFNLKKTTLKRYIEAIWGWDDAFQYRLLQDEFNPADNQLIMVNGIKAGILELIINEDRCEIVEIELLPEFQGMGIGTRLIQRIIEEHKAIGRMIHLGCFKENLAAFTLYKRLGFQFYKETETHYLLKIEPCI